MVRTRRSPSSSQREQDQYDYNDDDDRSRGDDDQIHQIQEQQHLQQTDNGRYLQQEQPNSNTQDDNEEDAYEAAATMLTREIFANRLETELSAHDFQTVSDAGIIFVRAALSAELKNQTITKNYIQKFVLANKKVKFSHVFTYATILLEYMGFALIPIPNKNGEEVDYQKATTTLTYSYIIRSILLPQYQDIIGDYFISEAIDNDESIDNDDTPLSQLGPTVLLICCVILHGNNISKRELESIVPRFGIDKLKLDNLLKRSVKDEYLLEEVISQNRDTTPGTGAAALKKRRRTDTKTDPDAHIIYHIGRRTKVEMGKDKMNDFFRQILGDKYDAEKAAITLNCF